MRKTDEQLTVKPQPSAFSKTNTDFPSQRAMTGKKKEPKSIQLYSVSKKGGKDGTALV